MTFSASMIRRHIGAHGNGTTTRCEYLCPNDAPEKLVRSMASPAPLKLHGRGRPWTVLTRVIVTTATFMLVLVAVLFFVATHDLGHSVHRCKIALKHAANGVWDVCEQRGIIETAPAIVTDYHALYPEFAILEANAHVIQREFAQLMATKHHGTNGLVDMEHLNYRHGQLRYNWKAFSLNVAGYLPTNTRLLPQTTALLRQIPDLHSAMFSVMGPHQTIGPHFGIWKGMRRYHLGIDIPNNNAEANMWLRVNPDVVKHIDGNSKEEIALAYDGSAYYWKDGEGVMFDDTYLHVARNDADETRVVLLIDVLRRGLPWWLNVYNRLAVWMAEHDTRVTAVRAKVSVKMPLSTDSAVDKV